MVLLVPRSHGDAFSVPSCTALIRGAWQKPRGATGQLPSKLREFAARWLTRGEGGINHRASRKTAQGGERENDHET